jgi:hypothetical protein
MSVRLVGWGLGLGSREQGGGSREQGAGRREQGAGRREQGAGSREQGAGRRTRVGVERNKIVLFEFPFQHFDSGDDHNSPPGDNTAVCPSVTRL